MIFRATILESNPQIIRVFEIDPESSLEELLYTTAYVLGWEPFPLMHIYKEGREREKDELLQNHFGENTEEKDWVIRTPMGATALNKLDEDRIWRIRLEFLSGSKEEKEPVTRLIRYRGLNPIRNMWNIGSWNQLARELYQNNRYYDYSKGWLNLQDYTPNMNDINRKLKKLSQSGTVQMDLQWNKSMPIAELIGRLSLERMKMIINSNELPIRTNFRKVYVTDALQKYFETGKQWRKIIDEMNLEEYEAFLRFITEKEDSESDYFPTLYKYGVAERNDRNGKIFIARELMEAYEEMMDTEGDKELIKNKKIEVVFLCAQKLYGFFSQQLLLRLAKAMYPDEITDAELLAHWKAENGRMLLKSELYKRRIKSTEEVSEDVMFDKTLEVNDVLYLMRIMKSADMDYYIPDYETALKITRNPIDYSAEETSKLQRVLLYQMGIFRRSLISRIIEDIYWMCHLSLTTREIIERIRSKYGVAKVKTEEKALREAIVEYKEIVHQILLYGYTSLDAKILWNVELEDK